MGNAFLYGNGGGTELAIRIVGGTQRPKTGKQGTIWINTNQNITSWTIQVEEPTSPREGMVWIHNLTSAKINALKKNGIWFTPTSAKQYIGGAWVKKTGEYYNNGQWVALFEATIHVTYPAGSTCTATDGATTLQAPDTSGTWDCVVSNAGTWTVSLDSGLAETVDVTTSGNTYTVSNWYIYNEGAVKAGGSWQSTISGGYIVQDITMPGNGTRKIFTHSDPINVSGFTKATFVIKSSDPVYTYTEVGIYSTPGFAANLTPIAFANSDSYTPNEDVELSFTIPSRITECYFGFGVNRSGSGGANTTIKVKSIRIE